MQQRQQFHAHSQLFGGGKRPRLVEAEARVLTDVYVLHLERRRKKAEMHIAQSHLAPQPLLQLLLDLGVVLINVNQMRNDQHCRHQQHDDDENSNSKFAHGSPA
jgi:hypothetical protein